MVGNGKFTSKTCPPAPSSAATGDIIVGSWTFRHLLVLIACICTAITVLLSTVLVISHLRRYKVPREQRQIIRILWTPVVFAVVAIISIGDYRVGPYLAPFANLYEFFVLASLFLLFVNNIAPDSPFEYFSNFENSKQLGHETPKKNAGWFQVSMRY